MKQPNIMLVVLDATRADHCSCYGAKQMTTPALDQLATEGVLFEHAYSAAPWTLPAISSLFTGLFPSQTGIYGKLKLDATYPTLAELLAQQGYATFGITNNSWLSRNFGLQRGFDVFHKQWQWWQTSQDINKLVIRQESRKEQSDWRGAFEHMLRGNPVKNMVNTAFTRFYAYRRDLGARRMLKPVTQWVEKQQTPWFTMVHYLEAHLPYKAPLEWVSRFTSDLNLAKKMHQTDQYRMVWRHLAGVEVMSEEELRIWQDLYLACVAYQDHHLGLLIEWLRQSGRLDDTLLIIVADHGESLGEHGLLNHQYGLYDPLIHVPLVIRYPRLFPSGERVSDLVPTLDVFQTILDVANANSDEVSTSSQSLLSAQSPRSFVVSQYGTPRSPHAETLANYGLEPQQLSRYMRGFTALRTHTHKLIVGTDGSKELYHWLEDVEEENNLAELNPEMVAQLDQTLEAWQEEHGTTNLPDEIPQDVVMDRQLEARLQALGYLE